MDVYFVQDEKKKKKKKKIIQMIKFRYSRRSMFYKILSEIKIQNFSIL